MSSCSSRAIRARSVSCASGAARPGRECARSSLRSWPGFRATAASACRRRAPLDEQCQRPAPSAPTSNDQRPPGCSPDSDPTTVGSRNRTSAPAGTSASLMPQRLSCRQSTCSTFRSRVTIGNAVGTTRRGGLAARACPAARLCAFWSFRLPPTMPWSMRRVHPGIDRRVRHRGDAVQVFQRVKVRALRHPCRPPCNRRWSWRQCAQPRFELCGRQPAQVLDPESRLERAELRADGDLDRLGRRRQHRTRRTHARAPGCSRAASISVPT